MHQFRTGACLRRRVALVEPVFHSPHHPSLVALLACLAFSAGGARAQELLDPAQREYAFEQTKTPPTQWQFVLGVGVASDPRYPGSDSMETRGVPLISVSYDRYFIGSSAVSSSPLSLGAWLIRTPQWAVAVAASSDAAQARYASDSPLLNGWGDIDRTLFAGVFVSYTVAPWLIASGLVAADVAGKGQGAQANFSLTARYSPTQRLLLSAGPILRWTNSEYTQTFFGITSAQSAIAGVPPYQAQGGLNWVRFSVAAGYSLTPQWEVGASAVAGWLQGDAAKSPITQQKSQNTFLVFCRYRS
jgi:outer membrane protein